MSLDGGSGFWVCITIIQSVMSGPKQTTRRRAVTAKHTVPTLARSLSRLDSKFPFLLLFVHFHLSLYNGRDDMDNELNEI